MTTAAFTGGNTLKIGDGAGTEVFTALGDVDSVDGIGVTNAEIRTTSWENLAHAYIAGMPDGNQVTITVNTVLTDAQVNQVITDVENREAARNFEYVLTDGTTVRTGSFAMTMLSYQYNASTGEQSSPNQIVLTGRITNGISWTDV